MEVLSIQCGSLKSTLHPRSVLLPNGRTRKGCIRDPFICYRRLQDTAGFRAVLLNTSSRFMKTQFLSSAHSTNGSLADYILCAAEEEHELLLKKRANEIGKELKGTCIFLIGMMGSGKTTVGEVLARALGYYFFDSDKVIEEAAGGLSVAQIFHEHDEDSFRDAETEVLKQLSSMGRLVVATGGGIVLRPMNWSYLKHGITVWLDVPLEALAERVVAVGTESRPLLGQTGGTSAYSEALSSLSHIFEVRGPFYADADARVSLQQMALKMGYQDVSALTPTMIAVQVLEEIVKLIKRKK